MPTPILAKVCVYACVLLNGAPVQCVDRPLDDPENVQLRHCSDFGCRWSSSGMAAA